MLILCVESILVSRRNANRGFPYPQKRPRLLTSLSFRADRLTASLAVTPAAFSENIGNRKKQPGRRDEQKAISMKHPWIADSLLSKRGVTKDLQPEWNWICYHIGGKCLPPSYWMAAIGSITST